MGKLITLSVFYSGRDRRTPDEDASWYFTDAYWSSDSDRYVFAWPSPDFPHSVFIHSDSLTRRYQGDNKNKIRIRKWIEHLVPDTVIVSSVDYSYRKFYGDKFDWERSYEIHNVWERFSFENAESATAFALAFSDIVATPTAWHPNNPEDKEYLEEQNRASRNGYVTS